jgi:diguanylate cyclase (GGDEF)-like protein
MVGMAMLCLLSPAYAKDRAAAIKLTQKALTTKDDIQQIKLLNDAVNADDTYAPAVFAKAKLVQAGHDHDYDTAISNLQRVLKLAPGTAEAKESRHLIVDYAMLDADGASDPNKDYKVAAEMLERLSAANKKDASLASQLGHVYMLLGDPDKARPALERALTLDPNDPVALSGMGAILSKDPKTWLEAQADYQKALDGYQKALDKIKDKGSVAAITLSHGQTDASHGLADVKNDILVKKVKTYGGIGAGVLLLLVIGGALASRRPKGAKPGKMTVEKAGKPPKAAKAAAAPAANIPDQAAAANDTPEGVVENAMYQIARITGMSEGAAWSMTMDLDTLLPRASLNIDLDELNRQPIDPDKFQQWHERIGGTPFIFAQERREATFEQAFGDLKEHMEGREMKLGIPLASNGTFYGIIFLGLGKDAADDQKAKLKKQFEKNIANIQRLADEAGGLLQAMIEHEQSYTDTITKFKTARYIDENLPDFLNRAQRSGNFCIGIMLEYDSYQQIRETYGENQGTTVLKLLAGDIRRVLNEDADMIARLEDGVFVAFTEHAEEAHATRLGNRLLEQVKSMKISRTLPLPTASIGVAVYPTHANTAGDLMARMRDALGQSINTGRGSLTVLPLASAEPAQSSSPFPARTVSSPSGTLGGSPFQRPGPVSSSSGGLGPSPFGRGVPPTPPVVSNPSGGLGGNSPFGRGVPPTPPVSSQSGSLNNSPFGRGVPPTPPVVSGPSGGLGGNSPFGRGVPPTPGAAPPGGSVSPFGRPAAGAPPPANSSGGPPSPFGRGPAPPSGGLPAPSASPFARPTPPATPPTPPAAAPAAPAPASLFGRPPVPTPAQPTPPTNPMLGANTAGGAEPPRAPASPFVPGRPAGAAPSSPFVPGRPVPAAGAGAPGGPFIPGRPNAGPAASPFVPGRPGVIPPAADENGRAAAPGSPAPPVPFIPTRRGPPASVTPRGDEGVEEAAPAAAPAFPPKPAATPIRPAVSPAIAPAPGRAADGPAPPPFVPSRRQEPKKPMPPVPTGNVFAPPTAPLAVVSPADRSGYLSADAFATQLEQTVAEARGGQFDVSLVYLGIDRFGDLEERGPELVNKCVTSITGMVKSLLNEAEDIAGVVGPNGFVIIKPRTEPEGGMNFAEWVRVTVGHLSFPELSEPVTVSLGVATFPHDAEDAHGLLSQAESACAEAGRRGGNCSVQVGT